MKVNLRPTLGAAAWTAALALGLLGLDRIVAGPRGPAGWRSAPRLADLPEPPWLPSYLPPSLEWPAAQLLLHPEPPGWWIRLDDADGPAVWIGSSRVAAPADLDDAATCLEGRDRCPRGWRVWSKARDAGPPVHLLTRLPAKELRRMRKTLGPRAL